MVRCHPPAVEKVIAPIEVGMKIFLNEEGERQPQGCALMEFAQESFTIVEERGSWPGYSRLRHILP